MKKIIYSEFTSVVVGSTTPSFGFFKLDELKDFLGGLVLDGLIEADEKEAFNLNIANILGIAQSIIDNAYTGYDTTSLQATKDALETYVSSLTDINNNAVDTTISREEFNTKLNDLLVEAKKAQELIVDYQPQKTEKISLQGRIEDPTFYNTQNIVGVKNITDLDPTYTINGTTDVTITLPAHTRTIVGENGPVVLTYGAMSANWDFDSYWAAWIDDANLTGDPTPTLNLTDDPEDLLYPNRYHIASGITPDSAGSGGGSSGGGGYGGGYPNCVYYESYIDEFTMAKEIKQGDTVFVLGNSGYTLKEVRANKLAKEECVRLVTLKGLTVTVSKSTPLTLKTGEVEYYDSIVGKELACLDRGDFFWDEVVKVIDVGKKIVAKIDVNNCTYAAGDVPNRLVFTHNTTSKP